MWFHLIYRLQGVKMQRICLILITIIGLLILTKIGNFSPKLNFVSVIQNQITKQQYNSSPQLIKINLQNEEIHSFLDENVSVMVKNGPIAWKFKGSLAYQKDKNFRLQIFGLLGKTLDLGSNNQMFWFWSKTMNPPNLFYANHEDVHKSKLKTPFHPLWMMESISLTKIDLSNSKISSKDGMFIITEERLSTLNQIIKKTTLVDPDKGIIGHYITDLKDNLICGSEVKEWNGNLPKVIIMIWYEENISIQMEFKNPEINKNISSEYWNKPKITPEIDMSKD